MSATNYPRGRLTSENVVVVFVDHQTGLIPGVEDHDRSALKRNARALGRTATAFGLPVVASTSAPQGPNGPMHPELVAEFPEGTPVIDRPGQVDAFDNDEFARAVRATGRPTIVLAGVITDVCLAFAALHARAEGYEVHAVIDASGTVDPISRETTLFRLQQAGVTLNTTVGVVSELMGDWRVPQGEAVAAIFADLAMPFYAETVASWASSQAAAPGVGQVSTAPSLA